MERLLLIFATAGEGTEPSSNYSIISILMAVIPVAWALLLIGIVLWPILSVKLRIGSLSAKLHKGAPVIGYKVANLDGKGLSGVSGGGQYGFNDRGRLDPGFHGFKDLKSLMDSGYISSGELILEVLFYGDVVEYDDGYIASNQRVLQAVPNSYGVGYCRVCRRRKRDFYYDDEYPGLNYLDAEYLICSSCMKAQLFISRLAFWNKPSVRNQTGRFIPLGEHLQALSAQSGNTAPVVYVPKLSKLKPTVIPVESSAR